MENRLKKKIRIVLLCSQKNKDPESIEILGLCSDICVVSNALILKAKFPNTKIYVDKTCCAGTTISRHIAALDVTKEAIWIIKFVTELGVVPIISKPIDLFYDYNGTIA